MSQKISQLPAVIAANISDTDILPIVATNITSKVTVANLRTKLGTQPPTGGRTVTDAFTYLTNNAVFNVKDFGAFGDGVTDDTAAINLALTTAVAQGGGRVHFPRGTYKTTSNIVVSISDPHIGLVLTGEYGSTTIKPSSAVTIALTFACASTDANGLTSRFIADGFLLDGANTTGAVGVLVGDNTGHLSAYMSMYNFDIYGFHGANAKGLYIKDLVGGNFESVYVDRCTTDLYVNPSDATLPTVLSFRFCQFREADGNGIEIWNGYRMNFFQTVVEANFGRGIWVVPTNGTANVLWLEFDGLWLEMNCRNDATQYQLHVDGTLGGTVEIRVANANWSGSSKSLYLKNTHNVILDNIYPSNAAGKVLIDTGVNGFARNIPHNNFSWTTAVVNNSPSTFLLDFADAWQGTGYIDKATGNFVVVSGAPNLGAVANPFGNGYFKTLVSYYNQPAYGVAVNVDAATGNLQQINVTNGVAFTINNPTNPALSMFLTLNIRNVSGGAMGAITWDTKYKLAGAFVNPATGNSRQITFFYDSGNLKWYEVSRSAADVPN